MADVFPEDQDELDKPANIHSFVVRLWLEKLANGDCLTVWRGHITHIPGGERSFITDISSVPDLIQPFLQDPKEE